MKKIKRVASFTVFSNDYKSKLTTAYPFLTPDQIQMKLRKKWNNLSSQERKHYHKTVLCPVENVPKKENKPKNERKMLTKVPKDDNINLKELTLFDDDLELASDKMSEKYCLDDIFNKKEDDKFYVDIRKNKKTYTHSRYNVEQPVPMVIDETPFGQQGILKKSSFEKDKKMKVQFNFSTQLNKVMDDDEEPFVDDFHLSSLDKQTKEAKTEEITTKTLKNEDLISKANKQILNYESDWNPLESNEEVSKNISSENKIKPNQDLSKKVEPLTPELQRNQSPMIIQKMCQAPRKKATKGNYMSIEKMDGSGKKKTESLSASNLNKLAPRRKPTFQRNDFGGSPSDDLQFKDEELKKYFMDSEKRNKSLKDLKMLNTTKTDSYRFDDFSRSPSPSFDSDFDLNNTNDTSIGWELPDVSASNKHASSLENTLQLMRKSVSSSLTTIVRNSPDNLVSDCSSSLSGFTEFSDPELEMSDTSDNEMISDEIISDEKQYAIAGITPGGDLHNQCQLLKENKDQNRNNNLLCDMFEEKHSALTRTLLSPGNNGEQIAPEVFEDESIFG